MKWTKCVMVGSSGIGKTSALASYAQGRYVDAGSILKMDEGVRFHRETVIVGGKEQVDVALFSLPGGMEAKNVAVRKKEFANTDISILCFAVDDDRSIDEIEWYKNELKRSFQRCVFVLVGLRADARKVRQDKVDGHALAQKLGAFGYFECSAVDNKGFSRVVESVAQAFLTVESDFRESIAKLQRWNHLRHLEMKGLEQLQFVMIGDDGVGKYIAAGTFRDGKTPPEYLSATRECIVCEKVVDGKSRNCHFHVVAGGPEYSKFRPFLYERMDVAVLCFSVTDSNSFEHLKSLYLPELIQGRYRNPMVVMGLQTKENQTTTIITKEQGERFARDIGAQAYVECSITNLGSVNRAFHHLVQIGVTSTFNTKLPTSSKWVLNANPCKIS